MATDSSAVPTYINDNLINVAVSVTGSYSSARLQRQDSATGTIVTLGVVRSGDTWADTSVVAGSGYRYRVGWKNVSGDIVYTYPSTWGAYVYTSQQPPTNCRVSRNGTNVTVTWDNPGAAASQWEVWHAANGVWDGAALATVANGTLTYTAATISTTATHQFRVRGKLGTTYTSYATSPVMPVCAVPNAPTITAPAQANRAQPLVVGVRHNPTDYHVQTAGTLRYRLVGAGSWTTVALGTATSYTFAAGSPASGSYEFQAQTQGLTTLGSGPFSASTVVVVTTPPTVNLTSPAGGVTVTTARITPAWSYFDAEGTPQAAWELHLTNTTTGVVVWTAQQVGAAASYPIPYTLADNTPYTIAVRVQDGAGAWSDWDVHAFPVDYIAPPAPGFTTAWDPDLGAATLTITNPAAGGGQVAAVSNNVYRNGLLIAEGIALGGSYVDRIPPTNTTVTYRVEAVSAGYTTASTSHGLATPSPCWVFLNGGAGYATLGRLRDGAAITSVPDRTKSLITFEGRDLPTEFAGQGRTRALRVSGDVNTYSDDDTTDPLGPRGTWQPFEQLAEALAPLCYRDMLGRRWLCSVDAVTTGVTSQDGRTTSVSYVVTQVGDNE